MLAIINKKASATRPLGAPTLSLGSTGGLWPQPFAHSKYATGQGKGSLVVDVGEWIWIQRRTATDDPDTVFNWIRSGTRINKPEMLQVLMWRVQVRVLKIFNRVLSSIFWVGISLSAIKSTRNRGYFWQQYYISGTSIWGEGVSDVVSLYPNGSSFRHSILRRIRVRQLFSPQSRPLRSMINYDNAILLRPYNLCQSRTQDHTLFPLPISRPSPSLLHSPHSSHPSNIVIRLLPKKFSFISN